MSRRDPLIIINQPINQSINQSINQPPALSLSLFISYIYICKYITHTYMRISEKHKQVPYGSGDFYPSLPTWHLPCPSPLPPTNALASEAPISRSSCSRHQNHIMSIDFTFPSFSYLLFWLNIWSVQLQGPVSCLVPYHTSAAMSFKPLILPETRSNQLPTRRLKVWIPTRLHTPRNKVFQRP